MVEFWEVTLEVVLEALQVTSEVLPSEMALVATGALEGEMAMVAI